MYEITDEVLKKAYKPFDIVSDAYGNVGMIREVGVSSCQPDFDGQIKYAITWLTGAINKTAWFYHKELSRHCNIMIKIAECAASHNSDVYVDRLFKNL